MQVVSDCSPLIHFSSIHRLDVLRSLFTCIFIPPAVYRECVTDGVGWLNAADLQAAIQGKTWLMVQPLRSGILLPGTSHLDPGEAEAITLAHELKLSVLIDEREGRTVAERLGIPFLGTLGALASAKARNLIMATKPLIEIMEQKGYYLSPDLKKRFLRSCGER